MKSGKQRRNEIRARRLKRAKARKVAKIDAPWLLGNSKVEIPAGYVLADPEQLVHNNSYGLPLYYQDRAFVCATCEKEDLWTAKQQKWWYEIAKGDINTTAKYCRPCRISNRKERNENRKTHFTGLIEKHGLAQAAKLLDRSEEELEKWLSNTRLK